MSNKPHAWDLRDDMGHFCFTRQESVATDWLNSNSTNQAIPLYPNVEEDAARLRETLAEVESVASLYCEYLHHARKDQHKLGEPCPVELRIRTAIDAARTVTTPTPEDRVSEAKKAVDAVLTEFAPISASDVLLSVERMAETIATLRADVTRMAAKRRAAAEANLLAHEDAEASVCPEDVGFVEYINSLKDRVAALEAVAVDEGAVERAAISLRMEFVNENDGPWEGLGELDKGSYRLMARAALRAAVDFTK